MTALVDMVLKKIKKIVKIILISLALLLLGGVAMSYFFKDELVQVVLDELNEQVNTTLSIEKTDFSVWKKFPQIAVELENVVLKSSLLEEDILMKAGNVFFAFDPLDLIRGNYTLKQIYIKDAVIRMRREASGARNFEFIHQTSGKQKNSTIIFDLSKINLTQVDYEYYDELKSQRFSVLLHEAQAKLNIQHEKYDIQLDGDLKIQTIALKDQEFFKDKSLTINSSIIYNDSLKSINIYSSELQVASSTFLLEGRYGFLDQNEINLEIEGQNSDFYTLLSLAPEHIAQKFDVFKM